MIEKLWSQVSVWNLLLTFSLLLLLRISWKYLDLCLTIRRLRYYGGEPCFNFPLGHFQLLYQNQQKGDTISWQKTLPSQNPQVRFIATHVMTQLHLQLIDPDLIKDFLSDQTRYRKSGLTDLPGLVFGSGLIFAEGNTWKKHRRAISEVFRFDFLSSQIPTTTYPMQDQLLYLYPSLNASLFQNITPLKYIPVSQYTGNPNFSDDEGNFHRDFLNIE